MPSTAPVFVRGSPESARAIPKSVTFTSPCGVTSTLPGFTSRCTTPCACANDSASAISAVRRAASIGASGAYDWMMSRSVWPGTYSITM